MAAHYYNSHSGDEQHEDVSVPGIKIYEPEVSWNRGRENARYEEHVGMQYNPNVQLYPTTREHIYDHEPDFSNKSTLRAAPLSITTEQPSCSFLSSPYILSPDWRQYESMTSETGDRLTLSGHSPHSDSSVSTASNFLSDVSSPYQESFITPTYPNNGGFVPAASNGRLWDEHGNHSDNTRSNISTEDVIMLLSALGCQDLVNQDPTIIRQQFSNLLSIANQKSFASKTRFQKPMKAKVSSLAGRAASSFRRKNNASFICELEACNGSFTRKNGLLNHYKAHLGIADKICKFCGQGFTTSLSRHERNCKQKSQVGSLPQRESLFIRVDPHTFGGTSP